MSLTKKTFITPSNLVFSIAQDAMGSTLQFEPELGSVELDLAIDDYVPGNAPISEKRMQAALEFFNARETFTCAITGELSVSPPRVSALKTKASRSSKTSKPKVSKSKAAATKMSAARVPGYSIMTRDGVDITDCASRGPKTKEQRDRAARMRKLGACDNCRRSKQRCEPSHPRGTFTPSSATVSTPSSSASGTNADFAHQVADSFDTPLWQPGEDPFAAENIFDGSILDVDGELGFNDFAPFYNDFTMAPFLPASGSINSWDYSSISPGLMAADSFSSFSSHDSGVQVSPFDSSLGRLDAVNGPDSHFSKFSSAAPSVDASPPQLSPNDSSPSSAGLSPSLSGVSPGVSMDLSQSQEASPFMSSSMSDSFGGSPGVFSRVSPPSSVELADANRPAVLQSAGRHIPPRPASLEERTIALETVDAEINGWFMAYSWAGDREQSSSGEHEEAKQVRRSRSDSLSLHVSSQSGDVAHEHVLRRPQNLFPVSHRAPLSSESSIQTLFDLPGRSQGGLGDMPLAPIDSGRTQSEPRLVESAGSSAPILGSLSRSRHVPVDAAAAASTSSSTAQTAAVNSSVVTSPLETRVQQGFVPHTSRHPLTESSATGDWSLGHSEPQQVVFRLPSVAMAGGQEKTESQKMVSRVNSALAVPREKLIVNALQVLGLAILQLLLMGCAMNGRVPHVTGVALAVLSATTLFVSSSSFSRRFGSLSTVIEKMSSTSSRAFKTCSPKSSRAGPSSRRNQNLCLRPARVL